MASTRVGVFLPSAAEVSLEAWDLKPLYGKGGGSSMDGCRFESDEEMVEANRERVETNQMHL